MQEGSRKDRFVAGRRGIINCNAMIGGVEQVWRGRFFESNQREDFSGEGTPRRGNWRVTSWEKELDGRLDIDFTRFA